MAYESYHRTARKEYTCDKCGSPILPGDYYEWYRYTGGGYGLNNPSRFHTKPTCEEAKKREEERARSPILQRMIDRERKLDRLRDSAPGR